MKDRRLYQRHTTPAGMVVRVGDRYINAQSIELRVARIFSLSADADERIRSGEGSARPCV